jgi:hypothetical protein
MKPQIAGRCAAAVVVLAGIALTTVVPTAAQEVNRPQARTLAVLPDGATGPEGL